MRLKRPWFRAVRKLGWDYVGRVRVERTHVQLGVGDPAITVGKLYERATAKAQRFEYAGLGQQDVLRCDLVLYKIVQLRRIRTTLRGAPGVGGAAQRRSVHPHRFTL